MPSRVRNHSVKKGKTPVLTAGEARELLDAIETDMLIGLRDRALIGLMVYTFARVGAALKMRVEDYFVQGRRGWVRLHKKAASCILCPAITTWRPGLMNTSRPPASKRKSAI